jgi:hypothetical protein
VLIDFAIRRDRNVIKRVVEMIRKCKDLITEIYNMWNATTKVTPEIVGAKN